MPKKNSKDLEDLKKTLKLDPTFTQQINMVQFFQSI